MRVILRYCTIFFLIGFIFDTILYFIDNKLLLVVLNISSILTIIVSVVLYFNKKIDAANTIFILLLSIALNVCASMICESLYVTAESREIILLNMSIYMVPIILSALIKYRSAPIWLTIVGLLSYTAASLLIGDMSLLERLPILALIFVGVPIALVNVLDVTKSIAEENAKVTRQREELLRLLDMEPEQLQLVESGSMSKKSAAKILDKMDSRMRNLLVDRVKNVINSEERVVAALKSKYPTLTASELEICRFVVEGKSVSEICEIRHVSTSTVTSIRSRLRKKLGLAHGESLQSYLQSIVNAAEI